MTYSVMEDCLKADYPWLLQDVKAGTIVHAFYGPTYGCIGPEGTAVFNGKEDDPFYELPDRVLKKK